MIPDELRKLADEAKSLPIVRPWTGQMTVQTGSRKTRELQQLERMAPDLARLCAEFAEALNGVAILEMHPDFSDEENETFRQRAVAARAVLVKLAELEPA